MSTISKKTTSQKKSAEIIPHVSLMKKMAHIAGTITSRVMELIDNSIDARVEGEKLEIVITINNQKGKEYIEIKDNGYGMDEMTARSFFRLADSEKAGEKKIGRFGLGAKVAIMGLGDTCIVDTTPLGQSYGVSINFDSREFSEWKIEYALRHEKSSSHGTRIRINDLSVRIANLQRFISRIADQCSRSYKHYLKNGDVSIVINGEELVLQDVQLLDGVRQEFDFTINGKRVHGWAGATASADTNWDYGFDLLSCGRIIKSRDLLSSNPNLNLSRLVGEIHLDEFQTDIHKTDFIRHDMDFEEMEKHLTENVLKDLLNQVAQLTNKDVFVRHERDMSNVSDKLNKIMHNIEFLENIEISDGVFKKVNPQRKASTSVPKKEQDILGIIDAMFRKEEREVSSLVDPKDSKKKKKAKRRNDIGLLIHDPMPVSAGANESLKRWYAEERRDGYHLHIEVNIDHPAYLMEDEKESATFMKNTIIDSVAEFVLEQEKSNGLLLESEVERLNHIKDLLFRYMIIS